MQIHASVCLWYFYMMPAVCEALQRVGRQILALQDLQSKQKFGEGQQRQWLHLNGNAISCIMNFIGMRKMLGLMHFL